MIAAYPRGARPPSASVWALLIVGSTQLTSARIDLELRPDFQTVEAGMPVELGLYAVSDDETDQLLSAIDLVFGWDPEILGKVDVDFTNAVPLLFSGFPFEPFGLNESFPPADGDGFYQAFAPLGSPVVATPSGTLITTFVMEALEAGDTRFEILDSGGFPTGETRVYDGTVPNTVVTGTLSSASIEVVEGGLNLTLLPRTDLLTPGEILRFEVEVENLSDAPISATVWVDVFYADGRPFEGNPIKQPTTEEVGPGEVTRLENRKIPAPLDLEPGGPYSVVGYLGEFPDVVIDSDRFEFDVVEP